MLKKLVAASLIAMACSTAAYAGAGSFYMGPSVMLNYLSAKNSSYLSLSPRLSAGYGGYVSDSFYLAGELTATPGSIDLNNNYTKGTSQNAKMTHSYGLSVLPGVKLCDTMMLYGRVGAVDSYFTAPAKKVVGTQVGLGLETALSPDWNLRTEYIHTAYRSVSSDIGSPNANTIGLGLIHTFN